MQLRIIFYDQKRNGSAAESYQRLYDRLPQKIISLPSVKEWYGKFRRDLKMPLAVEDLLLQMTMISAKHFRTISVFKLRA